MTISFLKSQPKITSTFFVDKQYARRIFHETDSVECKVHKFTDLLEPPIVILIETAAKKGPYIFTSKCALK